ncbi:MAG: U32 family peptidase C-terminal domain-containing protein, partial [Acidaminococcaceae bacterium]|nr:U32 family peptidase C-terminal domain-containing protein [Acidaminococcaceae bacterium]
MKEGEILEVFCPDGSLRSLTLQDMRDQDGNPITSAPHAQQVFTCRTESEMPSSSILRRRIV